MDHIPILGPNGEEQFRFGGAASWKQRFLKDYVVSFEWFGPNGREVDACIVIWNQRKNTHDAGCYIVARRQITKYCDEHMKPTPYGFSECASALEVLGRMQITQEVHTLMDVILACIDDLVHMPVAPKRVREHLAHQPMFEITHKEKHSGRVLRESVV